MAKRGKGYQAATATVGLEELRETRQALETVKETAYAKFDETLEITENESPAVPSSANITTSSVAPKLNARSLAVTLSKIGSRPV